MALHGWMEEVVVNRGALEVTRGYYQAKTTRYAKTTATAPTYIGTVSAPSPIPAQSPLLADALLESAALLRVSSSRRGFIACSCVLPDSPSTSHTQVAYSRRLVCG